MFSFDSTGIDPNGGFPLLPEGWFPFRVLVATEGVSKSGNKQVTVDAVCLDPRFKDYSIRHWITFLPTGSKGAGMAIHWLKSIGEPWEGKIKVDPLSWERKTFMGKVEVSEYQGKKNNKLAEISPIKDSDEFGPLPADPVGKTAFDE